MSEINSSTLRESIEENRTRLIYKVLKYFNDEGHEFVSPDIDTDDFPVSELHQRLQSLTKVESTSPDSIENQLLKGYRQAYRISPSRGDAQSIDGVVSELGPSALNLDKMNDFGVPPLNQLLINRAVIVAAQSRIVQASVGKSRYTRAQQEKLLKKARSNLNHFANNLCPLPSEEAELEEAMGFQTRYALAFLAKSIQREQEISGLELKESSIKEALAIDIPYSLILSGERDEFLSVFSQGSILGHQGSSPSKIKRMNIEELDEKRIINLSEVASDMAQNGRTYHVYQTYQPFAEISEPTHTPDRPIKDEDIHEVQTDDQKHEEIRDEDIESGDYTLIVIKSTNSAGDTVYDVIADNPEKGNAFYALRHEVLGRWHELTGLKFTWYDIFSYKRTIAQQLGARQMVHTKSLKRRATGYLMQETESMLDETFAKIFDPKREIFDENRMPARKNRLPKYVNEAVENSEIMTEIWPLVQKHGFIDAMRIVRDDMEVEIRQEQSKKSPEEYLADAEQIIRDMIKSRSYLPDEFKS